MCSRIHPARAGTAAVFNMPKSIQLLRFALGLSLLACAGDPARNVAVAAAAAAAPRPAPAASAVLTATPPVAAAPVRETCEPLSIAPPEPIETRFDVPLPPLIDPEWRG